MSGEMTSRKSWFQIIRWKLAVAVIVGAGLWVGSGQVGFPAIFQWMFAAYAVLGFVVFVLLDAPSPKALSGWKAGIGILVFYLICSSAYVAASHLLPQFTSQTEVDGIARKTVKYRRSPEATESLAAKTKELSAKADELLAKLNQLQASGAHIDLASGVESAGASMTSATGGSIAGLSGPELVERGKLVFQDQECYNCHKIGGKGGKKRGPLLDNIGNLATAAQMQDKIFHPDVWKADGFEERKKDKMPDKYPDVMSQDELTALVAYLVTLKNPSVETPKPIFPPSYSVK